MQDEVLVQLSVIRGIDLPKTDRTSKIDAYIKLQAGTFAGKTKTVDDDNNPVWNTNFFITMPMGPNRAPAGELRFELWDENTFKDTLIATAALSLGNLQPANMSYIELPLVGVKDKYQQQGKQSRLVVGVAGWVVSFGVLMATTRHIPGALFNVVDRRAYLPIPSPTLPPGVVYLACEYESDSVDFKVCVCQPNMPLFVDLAMVGRQHTKVRRRVYSQGRPIMPGLTAYEEVKLDDVPLSTDFRQLLLLCFDKQTLHSVDIDHSEREIYMKISDGGPAAAMAPPEALLLVDYDKEDVDIKLAVLDAPTSLDKAWDLTLHSGQMVKKTSEIFVPPKVKLGGKFQVARIYELDDVAYGTSFSDILVHKYQLTNQRQWDIQSILPIR